MATLAGNQRVIRQWGHYQVLASTTQLKFKKLVLMPGKSTSLQYHLHRSEFWTILSGRGIALINGVKHMLHADLTLWVEAHEVHQLTNTGLKPLIIHEVQQGSYLYEDDIIRLDDLPLAASLSCAQALPNHH